MTYAVCVTFRLHTGHLPDFMPLMLSNARTSLDVEPGCQRFDVCTDPDRLDTVFLYEIYSDQAGFDAHLASDHFTTFDRAVKHMIAEKVIATWSQVVS